MEKSKHCHWDENLGFEFLQTAERFTCTWKSACHARFFSSIFFFVFDFDHFVVVLKICFSFQNHVLNCNDKASFDRYKYNVPTMHEQKASANTNQVAFIPADSEDNWDDCNEKTYNPQNYVEKAPVIRTLNVAPPAQRRAFSEAERIRLNAMKRN